MFRGRKIDQKFNRIHERALKACLNDPTFHPTLTQHLCWVKMLDPRRETCQRETLSSLLNPTFQSSLVRHTIRRNRCYLRRNRC